MGGSVDLRPLLIEAYRKEGYISSPLDIDIRPIYIYSYTHLDIYLYINTL